MFEHRDETGRHDLGVEAIMRAFEHSEGFQMKVEYFPVKRAIYMFEKGCVDIFLGSRLAVSMAKDSFLAASDNIVKSRGVLPSTRL